MEEQFSGLNVVSYIFLIDQDSIAEQFQNIISWKSNAFRDKLSKDIMRKIDNSKYVGKYEIKTPIGKTIVTSMCTGAKLALLLEYYRKQKIVVYTKHSCAGENVWEYLAKSDNEYTFNVCIEDSIFRWRQLGEYIRDFNEEEWKEYFHMELMRCDLC